MVKKKRKVIEMKKTKTMLTRMASLALCLVLLLSLFCGCGAESTSFGGALEDSNAAGFEGDGAQNLISADSADMTESSSQAEAIPIEIPEAGNIVASGWCGEDSEWGDNGYGGVECINSNASWTLDDQGILTISGTGRMSGTAEEVYQGHDDYWGYDTYSLECVAPWYDLRENVKYIIVQEGINYISELAFSDCTNVLIAQLPESLQYIDSGAFYKCQFLVEIDIPDSVKSIGDGCFQECESLTKVELPSELCYIQSYTFDGCESLKSIVVPESVEYILSHAFWACDNLTEISLPDSLKLIESGAFGYTGYYDDPQNWDNGVLYIGNCLIDADEAISGNYNIKDGTTVIAHDAFENCMDLKSITIPDTVSYINTWAFARSGITDITFKGNPPVYINHQAFDGITATIHYPGNNAAWTGEFEEWEFDDFEDFGRAEITWVADAP